MSWRRDTYAGVPVLRLGPDRYNFDRRVSLESSEVHAVRIDFYASGRDSEDGEDIPCEVLAEALRARGWRVDPPEVP